MLFLGCSGSTFQSGADQDKKKVQSQKQEESAGLDESDDPDSTSEGESEESIDQDPQGDYAGFFNDDRDEDSLKFEDGQWILYLGPDFEQSEVFSEWSTEVTWKRVSTVTS